MKKDKNGSWKLMENGSKSLCFQVHPLNCSTLSKKERKKLIEVMACYVLTKRR